MKKKILFISLFVLLFLITSIPDDVTARRARAYGTDCEDTDNGYTYDTQGTVTLTGRRGEKEFTDYCRDENRILEYKCGRRYGGWIAFNRIRTCSIEFGESFSCVEGACVEKNFYDNFEGGELDEDLWEIRRDPENQPFMEEYGVEEEDDNFVFHMQQNEIADRRVYLVPTHMFVEGDTFEYDSNVVSREGHYGILVIVRGNGWNRQLVGGNGYNNGVQGYDELGWGHMIIEFSDGNIITTNEAPSGEIVNWEEELPDPDGEYEVYVGAFSGHNGRAHIDFDNFELNSE